MAEAFPPPDDLLALHWAALANAGELLSDAKRLAEAGSFPRAHALAVLACEEVGKGHLCLIALLGLVMGLEPQMSPKSFWKTFRDHKVKLERTQGFAALTGDEPVGPIAEFRDSLARASASVHQHKLQGLYVDYEMRVLLPSRIGAVEAHAAIADVSESLDLAARASPPKSLADSLPQAGDLARALLAAAQVNADDAVAALQQAVHGAPEALKMLLMDAPKSASPPA